MLVALGLRPDGKKEIIDFRLAGSESAAEWERFLTDLYRRGLTGEGLDMICVDGGQGLLAALPTVFPGIPVQRCWAHKIRNILNKVTQADQPAVKRALHKVMNATNAPAARSAAGRFADRFEPQLSRRRRLPAQRPRRALHLLPLQIRGAAQGSANHQRHRAPLPRGQAPNPSHGRLPGQNLHGSHPLRRLHLRKQITGRQHSFPADTEQLTLPAARRAIGNMPLAM